MAYQVIARKYRPQRFGDVVGQDHVAQTLTNAIGQKRIAHAYLFCGPRGTGKTTLARIFAKCLNCTDGPKVDFDDADSRCQEIAEGRSLDVIEIDGASNRGIDEVRELRDTVKYAPATGRFKIYIIDEVHMLTKEAFNALLKTLEEPPAHAKFMFATTEPEKVLPTILSRCQRFDLRKIPAALIVKHLAYIASKENVRIDGAALHAIARGADGAMRDAESTLDQLISFCGEKIEEPDVLSMFGLTAQSQILELARAILAGEAEPPHSPSKPRPSAATRSPASWKC
jgi:DNA polymerase III subunit gamma/tau